MTDAGGVGEPGHARARRAGGSGHAGGLGRCRGSAERRGDQPASGARYQAARPLARHLAQLISGLLARSPDRAATLALAGVTAPPPGDPGQPAVAIVVCYDGCWYQHAARFLAHERGAAISMAGLHDAIRWHAASVFSCPVQRVTITQAHYVAGRDAAGRDGPGWAQALADRGIIRHDVPVTAGKGEVGADVELALTCWQAACETSPDMIALLAGDGDFAPLAARLAGRGMRVLVPPV
jgi:hypothetical protein